MSRNYCRFVSCLVLLFVTILSTPSPNYSQAQSEEESTFIVMRLTTPKGHSAKIWLVEGEMTTIVDAKTGLGYGFVPVVQSLSDRMIEVKTFEVSKKESETTVGREVAANKIKIGGQQQFDDIAFTVKIIAIVWDVKDTKVKSQPSNISGLSLPGCCIACDDEVVCGRCVLTDCGCCCVHCSPSVSPKTIKR